MVTSGIYKIQSLSNPERFYIGSATNIERRWYQHRHQLRNAKHHAFKLQRHFNVHGELDLDFIIIFKCADGLISWEQTFLDVLKPYFNSVPNAGSLKGLRHSDDTKRKISEAKKGSDYWTGRKHSAASKEKMRAAKLGRKLSEETRKKLSAAKIGNRNTVGNKNRLGKTVTPEAKRQISETLKRYHAEKKEAACKSI